MRGEPEPPATGARVPLAAAQEAKVAILKTADAIRRRAATLLAGRGITFQQYNVLRILRGAKAAPISSAQLGQRTIEVIAELDALLVDLEGKGLAHRQQDDGESRWSATASGLALLAPLDEPVADADRGAVGDLDEVEVRGLITLLERVRARA